jgi:hypothetical protein
MRLSYLLPIALLAVAACHDDGVSVNARPPLGGVRFINAVPDGGPGDIRMVDQVEWSASSVSGNSSCCGLAFRQGTVHWATEAKARHIRVFPSDSSIAVTSQILLDTTITIEANKNVTLMLVGSQATGGKVRFIQIDDNPGAVPNNKVAVRLVNASATGRCLLRLMATSSRTRRRPGCQRRPRSRRWVRCRRRPIFSAIQASSPSVRRRLATSRPSGEARRPRALPPPA